VPLDGENQAILMPNDCGMCFEGPSSMDSIEADILQALQRKFGGSPQPTDELAALGIDSLGMAEFSTEMENHFGVRVDEDILSVETVQELAEYIRGKMATPEG